MSNKLTDSEIVKALECISGKAKDWDCDKCPFDCAICTSFVAEKSLDLINRLQAENKDLFYKLEGVMHSVDKWLDGDELKQDEVNRAITMREKTLKIVEDLQAENERLKTELDFAKAFRKETEAEFSLMHRKYGRALDTARAEVDKVVRCKECEHYHKGKESTVCDYDYCDILYYCDGSHRTACEEDYCSYGKKRGNKV